MEENKMDVLDRIYVKNSSVATRKIADQIVLVPVEQKIDDAGIVFSLNDIAAGIWVQIDGKTPLAVIKDRIVDAFEVSSEKAEKDLSDFIFQLEGLDMISVVSAIALSFSHIDNAERM